VIGDSTIRPFIAYLLPVNHTSIFAISATRTPQNILEVNRRLRVSCARYGYTYIDYFTAMVGPDGMMRKELSDDGLHPNAAGFRIMASILLSALNERSQNGDQNP
jgi:lysophospholipase L1-like esterase